MANGKSFTKLDRVANDPLARLEYPYGCLFARIGIDATKLPQDDKAAEVRLMEAHEMRMNVPTVWIASVLVAKNGACEPMMLIELVDAVDEPVGIDRMGVRVEQGRSGRSVPAKRRILRPRHGDDRDARISGDRSGGAHRAVA